MKRFTIILLFGIILFSCNASENKDNTLKNDSLNVDSKAKNSVEYTCPMHPEVLRKDPGTCPECGMELQARS